MSDIVLGYWHSSNIDTDLVVNDKGRLYWGYDTSGDGFTVKQIGSGSEQWKKHFRFEDWTKNV